MFKFRLTNVLHLREYKEKSCLEEIGKCLKQLQQELQKKEEIKEKIEKLEKELTAALRGTIIFEKVNLYKNFIIHQQYLLEKQEEIIREKKEQLAKAREKYFEAMKERKIMEKLRERQQDRYLQEEAKKEQNLQDELAITSKESKVRL